MEMNKEQVFNMFEYMENKQTESMKKEFFCQLGIECFNTRNVKKWINSFNGNIQAFLDRVNVEHASPYWEKLEFNPEKTILYLTGKPVEKCVCGFAGREKPAKSLCNYCCKTFQETMFGELFRHKVEVRITKSAIYGDDRCNTEISLQ
jgi:hypothetical protein